MSLTPQEPPRNWQDTSADLAPALLGAAAGIFIGDLMHRGARGPVALALACLGVAAATPTVVDAIRDKVAGPTTRRGTLRTLRSIREGSGAPPRRGDFVEEELGEQLFVG
jgi:hypothetical protein